MFDHALSKSSKYSSSQLWTLLVSYTLFQSVVYSFVRPCTLLVGHVVHARFHSDKHYSVHPYTLPIGPSTNLLSKCPYAFSQALIRSSKCSNSFSQVFILYPRYFHPLSLVLSPTLPGSHPYLLYLSMSDDLRVCTYFICSQAFASLTALRLVLIIFICKPSLAQQP